MPYPSIDLLAAAAGDLRGHQPLTIVTIPALLRVAKESGVPPTALQTFGSRQERVVLEAFRVDDSPKPYLAVWKSPVQRVSQRYDSTALQRMRTLDPIGRSTFRDDYNPPEQTKRTAFALQARAGAKLLEMGERRVSKVSLAAWLGRHLEFQDFSGLVSWFDETFPQTDTDLDGFYTDGFPASMDEDRAFAPHEVENQAIVDFFGVDMPDPAEGPPVLASVAVQPPGGETEDLAWTQDVCEYPLPNPDPQGIASAVLADLAARHIELPDAEQLIRRCVTALLVGHLVLTGPPGTGKTTLARALSRGFQSHLIEATATSEWSPYHVVGGFIPNASGGLAPSYGKVTEAALKCAELVRASVEVQDPDGTPDDTDPLPSAAPGYEAAWLFIDEFNRADIDKAIGSLYTLLSSCDPEHLRDSPIDLWFEARPGFSKVWVPARFRVIGAMNDLDTSFVNAISQGLTRRFQFITVGVPAITGTSERRVTSELDNAFAGAHAWLDRTYGSSVEVSPPEQARLNLNDQLERLQEVVDDLRHPEGIPGWPMGTAQVVDVLRVVLLSVTADPTFDKDRALDSAIADLLVPQMSGIDDVFFRRSSTAFGRLGLSESQAALTHVYDPHGIL